MISDDELRSSAKANAQRLADTLCQDESELERFPQFHQGLELIRRAARAADDVRKLLEHKSND